MITRYIIPFFCLIPFWLVLGTVFVVSPELGNGVVSGKYFWFYVSMGLISVTTVFITIFSKKNIRMNLLDGLVLLFGITALIFSRFIHHSEAETKHVLLILIVLLYFCFRIVFQADSNSKYWMTVCFIVTGLVEAVWGLMQLYGLKHSQHNLFHITGSFFNPGPYACYIAVVLPTALYFSIKYHNCRKFFAPSPFRAFVLFPLRAFTLSRLRVFIFWFVSVLTVAFSALILPASMSRAAWMAGFGGCSVVGLHFIVRNRKIKNFIFNNKKKIIFVASLAFIVTVAGGFGMYHLKKDSADGRTFIWKNTFTLIKENPFGVGISNFSGSYGDVQAAYFESGKGTEDEKRIAGNPEYAFNEYLQICAEQGIIVFVLFLCIILCVLVLPQRHRHKGKRVATAASLVALLIAAGFSYPFSVLPFLILLVFLLATNEGHADDTDKTDQRRFFKICVNPSNLRHLRAIIALSGVVITAFCLYHQYPTYEAYKKWREARIFCGLDYKWASEEYGKIYPLLSDQTRFLFEYAQNLSKSEQPSRSNEVLQRATQISCDPMLYNIMGKNYQALKQYTEAERCFQKSANVVPGRVYPYYLLALMYEESGETEKAKATARIVLTKEPKVQSTAIREMKDKMKKIINVEEDKKDIKTHTGRD